MKTIDPKSVVGLVSAITSHYDVADYNNINALKAVKELLSHDKDEVLREIEVRLRFIQRWKDKGSPTCKGCRGSGHGVDRRGDPWVCYDCKPDLKTFWENK